MHANLFLAKHALESFEMKPIAEEEEEEEEEKVEVAQLPVAEPKLPDLVQQQSGTATAVHGTSGAHCSHPCWDCWVAVVL